MYGNLPEYTRRWTRRHLTKTIDEFLKASYCIDAWEKKREQRAKWRHEEKFHIKETYRRDDEIIEVWQTMKFVGLSFSLYSVSKKYAMDNFEISFKRINSPERGEGYWWSDLFQLNRIVSYGGLSVSREVHEVVERLVYFLQKYLEDADIERDREIYVHCEKLIERAYELGINAGFSLGGAEFDEEFKQGLKEYGIPFRPYEIVNLLFYGNSQGGTYIREKMAELLIDSNRKIPFDFDAMETDDFGM